MEVDNKSTINFVIFFFYLVYKFNAIGKIMLKEFFSMKKKLFHFNSYARGSFKLALDEIITYIYYISSFTTSITLFSYILDKEYREEINIAKLIFVTSVLIFWWAIRNIFASRNVFWLYSDSLRLIGKLRDISIDKQSGEFTLKVANGSSIDIYIAYGDAVNSIFHYKKSYYIVGNIEFGHHESVIINDLDKRVTKKIFANYISKISE